MEGIETIDRECAALGSLFQQVVNDMKTGVPHYEDFISKAGKLHSQLKNTILSLGSFLDTFQKIADAATNTKGATREIGACLTRIVIRHKAMEARMKTLSSALLDCLVLPLQEKMEEWKKVAHSLDKDHSKEYKKLRQELKKKTDTQHRLMKKHSKNKKITLEVDPKVENNLAEVSKSVKSLHEVEKAAVRRVLIEERSRYCTFVACLKPVLGEEISMVSELQQLEEVKIKLDKHTEDPFKLPEASEQVLNDIKTAPGGEGGVGTTPLHYSPPASPTSLGSRKSSMCSISSAGSSSGGSTNSPSHQQQARHGRQGISNPMLAPMRLSSISSQDSGFTSQDTLFIRPGSPGSGSMSQQQAKTPDGIDDSNSGGSTPSWPGLVQGLPGPPITDRPHTISSAYERGSHQRPSLQPYTFNQPTQSNNNGTIPEEDEGISGKQPSRPPPLVPKRGVSEKPNVPGKTQAALMAKQKIAQQTGQLPNFNCSQPDMVVPQPVYMNMSDLESLAREKEQLHGLELKTPTQEDQTSLGPCSEGSSSGYGSQSTVRMDEQQDGLSDGVSVPAPAPLLDDSKYRSPTRGSSQYSSLGPHQRHALQRPFSFTSGVATPSVKQSEREFSEALGALQQLGMTATRGGTMLRRSSSQSQATSKPAPPMRMTPSGMSDCPPPPETGGEVSNSTTPRGSMESLPPPPPHLLANSDEEGEDDVRKSVADSVKELQRRQQEADGPPPHPNSPATLRRAQSMTGPPSDRTQIMARLDTVLSNSPRPPRPTSPQDQIYAPVAALQQKIQQQHQARLAHGHTDPGMVPHPPGPQIHDSGPVYASSNQIQQTSFNPVKNSSPEGDRYGFGMQFQQQSRNFHQHTSHHPGMIGVRQHPQHTFHQQQQQQHPNHQQHGIYEQYGGHQQHMYHDQVMSEVDPTLNQRPQPPDLNNGQQRWPSSNGGVPQMVHDPQSAQMRVRQWIETRTVSDVRKIRPVLNQEIQRGFSLRKPANGTVNDRSHPRF